MDVQVLYAEGIFPLRRVDVEQTSPLVLRLEGERAGHATGVRMNDVLVSEGLVRLSPHVLLVRVPPEFSARREIIRSITAVDTRERSHDTKQARILSFRLPAGSPRVTGGARLLQRFVTMLLTTPGDDIFSPRLGGGLTSIYGRWVAQGKDVQGVRSLVWQSVEKTAEDLRTIEATTVGERRLDEQFQAADLVQFAYDPRSLTLLFRLQVKSRANTTTEGTLLAPGDGG